MKKYLRTLIVFTIICASLFLTACTSNNVKIKEDKVAKIQYENFNNGLISMKIPKGWIVKINEKSDLSHFTFMVYNPADKDFQIFVNLKYEGFLKSQAAKTYFKRFGGGTPLANMPVLAQLSTEYYFKNTFSDVAKLNSTKDFTIPTMNDFTVVQNFGKTILGGDLLRATYKKADGTIIEGMFTASPYEIGSYYVNENPMNFRSKKIDTYYRNVYNTIFITAPESEFNNWQKVLTTSLDSLQYTDRLVKAVQSSNDSVMRTVQANRKTYGQISSMVMDSWEKRNKKYEVYKAYKGFIDEYKGKRFKPVTDEMYTKSVLGYIEKP